MKFRLELGPDGNFFRNDKRSTERYYLSLCREGLISLFPEISDDCKVVHVETFNVQPSWYTCKITLDEAGWPIVDGLNTSWAISPADIAKFIIEQPTPELFVKIWWE